MVARLIGFEHHSRPLLSRAAFLRRLAASFSAGLGLVAVSLAAGMAGYHWLEHLPWLDSFTNAAMILSGMGPLANPQTTGGKLFAGCYALYSGLVVILVAGVMFAPVFHRFLHKFHLEQDAGETEPEARREPTGTPRARGGKRRKGVTG
jgi:hypothetical protein